MDMVVRFLGKHGIELPLAARKGIVAAKEQIFRELLKDHARALPGVMQWLEFLSERHIRCALASSGEMANVVAVLEALQLSDYFAAILSGARLPRSKPDPALFLLAAAAVGTEPGKCLVVEDAPAGVQAAKAAGMVCCAVSTTCSADELQQADILLPNLGAADPASLFTEGTCGP